MMAIPMLPVTRMEQAFQLIQKERSINCRLKQFAPQLNQLFLYYKKQWLSPSMIAMVCVFDKPKRTNNFSECKRLGFVEFGRHFSL